MLYSGALTEDLGLVNIKIQATIFLKTGFSTDMSLRDLESGP